MNPTTHPVTAGRRKVFIPVLSAEDGVAEPFVRAVLGEPEAVSGAADLGHCHAYVEAIPPAEADAPGSKVKYQQADAIVWLVHFLDGRSLDQAREIRDRAIGGCAAPCGVFIYRPETERRFKMSCSECGQKLWVMEQEIGMRGRCVNCRRPMIVPSPSQIVRAALRLKDSVPVLNVVGCDASLCRGALENLVARTGPGLITSPGLPPEDFLKQATVPIQLDVSMLSR